MSSFLCFICHNTVQNDTTTEIREKYRELVGLKLCLDSQLCHICCHLINKLWMFKSICLRRSMEYPVLFSEKGAINLQSSNIETTTICTETEECTSHTDSKIYHFLFNEIDQNSNHSNQYVSLEEKFDNMHNLNDFNHEMEETQYNNVYDNCEVDNAVDVNNHFDNMQVENYDNNDATSNNDNQEGTQNNDTDASYDDDNDGETRNDNELKDSNDFHKVLLTVEEQKAELEAKRREDKYLEAEFKCYNCALGFLFKDTYQAHMMRHEESNGEHLCPICALRFASSRVLRAHATSHELRVSCVRCARPVRPRRLAAHRARCAHAAPAPCHLCGNTFADANGLQQHIKRFHLSKTSKKTYSCNICGKSYNNQGAVRTHMIKHINKKFTCDQCPSTFSSPYTLAQHRKKHTTVEEHRCETCNLSYGSRKSLLAHLRNSLSHQQSVFACAVCARSFGRRRALASHVLTHGASKPHQCALCPATYASRKSLTGHVRSFACAVCARSFGRRRALASHLLTHGASKPHQCALCPATYASRKSLTSHVRRHEGYAPKLAICHLCGASFKGNSKLNRHLRLVCEKAKLEEELSAYYNQE